MNYNGQQLVLSDRQAHFDIRRTYFCTDKANLRVCFALKINRETEDYKHQGSFYIETPFGSNLFM